MYETAQKRQFMLPSWLIDDIGGLPEPDEPPQKDSGKAAPPTEQPSIFPNGSHYLERLDIDQPPPEKDFDDQPEVMVCPTCGGWQHWQSVSGVWHCMGCDPTKPKAVQFARDAATIRARHQK